MSFFVILTLTMRLRRLYLCKLRYVKELVVYGQKFKRASDEKEAPRPQQALKNKSNRKRNKVAHETVSDFDKLHLHSLQSQGIPLHA